MTPEGVVKKKVKDYLKARGVASLSAPVPEAVGYYHMYVPSGYGDPALDFTGCYKGHFFAIETKAAGGTPSAQQRSIARTQQAANAFTIWGDDAEHIITLMEFFFNWVDVHQSPPPPLFVWPDK